MSTCRKCKAKLVHRYPGGDPENGPARLTCPNGHSTKCSTDGCEEDGYMDDGAGLYCMPCVNRQRAAAHVALGRLPFKSGLHEISPDEIAGLLCSAFEGGSNYWIATADAVPPPGTAYKDFHEGGKMQTDEYWHPRQLTPLHEGGAVDIVIDEPIDDRWILEYKLNRETITRGLGIMQLKYPKHWADFVADDGSADATTGDVFLQCCLFGELVFG